MQVVKSWLVFAIVLSCYLSSVVSGEEESEQQEAVVGSSTRRKEAVKVLVLGDSISTCNGLKSDFSFGYLSYRQPLWKMLTETKAEPGPMALRRKEQQEKGQGFQSGGWKFLSLPLSECINFVGTKRGCNKRLEKRYKAALEMPQVHDAVFGRTAKSVAENVQHIADKTNPDIVMLLIGVNDLLLENTPVDKVLEHYRKILSTFWIENPKVSFLIGTLPGAWLHKKMIKMKKPLETMLRNSVKLNEELRSYNGEFPNGQHSFISFTLVDLADGFKPKEMTYDGLHPDLDGEKHIAKRFFPALRKDLEKKGYICFSNAGEPATPVPPDPWEVTPAPPATLAPGDEEGEEQQHGGGYGPPGEKVVGEGGRQKKSLIHQPEQRVERNSALSTLLFLAILFGCPCLFCLGKLYLSFGKRRFTPPHSRTYL